MHEKIVAKKLELLTPRAILHAEPITGWEARLASYRSPGVYDFDTDWETWPASRGIPALKTVFLRTHCDLSPPTREDTTQWLAFRQTGLEALVSLDAKPYAGLDANHLKIPAPPPGTYALQVEGMAQLRAYCQPELKSAQASFAGARIIEIYPDIQGLVLDLQFLWQAAKATPDGYRAQRLDAVLDEVLHQIDLGVDTSVLKQDAVAARKLIAARLAEIAPDPEGGSVYLAGHTHIDTAYLWPIRETVRKCSRTFATAVRLMELYPEFHFSCSQAQLFAFTKQHYPALYDQIRHWVAEGRWHTTGAMWVESDCNVPCGESLVRQFLHGLRFFREEFGTRPLSCWLPDVFGYPGNLPQILDGCGLPYFMTCKLHWQATNAFPYHLFRWRGIDGTDVVAHIPRLKSYYNGYPNPEQLVFAWENYNQKCEHAEILLPFGYGDGGGGVTADMLEFARRAQKFPGLPSVRHGGEEAFFEEAAADAGKLPVWDGELYLETHRGTLTTQSRTKVDNRRAECELRDAEIWGVLANALGGQVDLRALDGAWRKVLLQQFHDILPGSSVHEVYDDAPRDYAEARETARTVRDAALAVLSGEADGTYCIFNSLSWGRTDPVEVVFPADLPEGFHVVFANGDAAPVQVLSRDAHGVRCVFEPEPVPAFGALTFRVEAGCHDFESISPQVSQLHLENAMFGVDLNPDGTIRQILDKRIDRNLIPEGLRANDWQFFQDGPERESAWNIHESFEKRRYENTETPSIRVLSHGPVMTSVVVEGCFRKSRYRQTITLYRRTPRIDIHAWVDWQERHVLLKAAFPVRVRSSQATYEIQFAAVERPTTRNTSWEQQKFEVAAQRWVDLSEDGYGVSLLNDGRYGHDIQGSNMRLTLLRGPEYPDPLADLGEHTFAYSLYPHSGTWGESGTVRRAAEFNVPMHIRPCDSRSAALRKVTAGLFSLEGRGGVLETVKPADNNDGVILRFYESQGGRGQMVLKTPLRIDSVEACNLVEELAQPVEADDHAFAFNLEPFQIRTFRLRFAHE